MSTDAAVRGARFQALIVPMLSDAYSLARFLARDATAAEDILQEACLRAYRHIDSLRSDDARAWLLTIVRNCFYASRTAECVALADSPSTAEQEDAYDHEEVCLELRDHADPQAILERSHDREVVHDLISQLPLQYREVLVLRELNELPYREIARVTGAPIGTVMSRLARARALLRTAWLEHPGNGGTT
ncbi:MAG TPA: sigma-70 family RNA polymerase sigma factor [Steroidobacteraceae bacterium]|nr:sigma-70 family RNA polymerase sigma factor [Steroidobacteraceae bacterium]